MKLYEVNKVLLDTVRQYSCSTDDKIVMLTIPSGDMGLYFKIKKFPEIISAMLNNSEVENIYVYENGFGVKLKEDAYDQLTSIGELFNELNYPCLSFVSYNEKGKVLPQEEE